MCSGNDPFNRQKSITCRFIGVKRAIRQIHGHRLPVAVTGGVKLRATVKQVCPRAAIQDIAASPAKQGIVPAPTPKPVPHEGDIVRFICL